jgi:hypothetical protein
MYAKQFDLTLGGGFAPSTWRIFPMVMFLTESSKGEGLLVR